MEEPRRRALVFSGDNVKPKTVQSLRPERPREYEESSEMAGIREQLYEDPDLSGFDTEKLNEIYASLREYRHHKALKQEYDEAQKARDLSEVVFQELQKRGPVSSATNFDENSLTARQNGFEDVWRRKMEKYDEETEVKIHGLREQQAERRREFENIWNQEMPRRYRKPSHQLLQLRKIEKSLALSSDFERAKVVHKEVEEMARREHEVQQENLLRDYAFAQNKLLSRQKADIKTLEDSRAHSRRCLLQEYEHEKIAVKNRSLVVKARKVEAEKGYRTANRGRSAIGTGATYSLSDGERSGVEDVLLAPMKPPNDPEFLENEKKRRRETNRRKLEYQRQYAASALAKYQRDDDGMSSGMEEEERTFESSGEIATRELPPSAPVEEPPDAPYYYQQAEAPVEVGP
jgi:hypothetical protein